MPAAKVEAVRLCGAGDTFAATMTLALSHGYRCGRACVLATLEAGRWVSCRPPATSFAELEEESRQHPEVTELRIAHQAKAA